MSNELYFVSVRFGVTDCEQKGRYTPFYKRDMPSKEITQVAQRQLPFFFFLFFFWKRALKIGLVVSTPLLHPHQGRTTGDENEMRW